MNTKSDYFKTALGFGVVKFGNVHTIINFKISYIIIFDHGY